MEESSSSLPITRRKNILLGISGSVASIKLNELILHLTTLNSRVNICVIPTNNSLHFVPHFQSIINKQMPTLTERLEFLLDNKEEKKSKEDNINTIFSFTDEDEWSSWQKRTDPVLHIELKKWADLFLIAPLDANTLAKLSNGLCDNLLTCVARAWDIREVIQKIRPVIVCPAMNTFMFEHPITARQLRVLGEEFGFTIVDCIEKVLVCGDVGMGAMASVESIVDVVKNLII